MSQMFYIVIFLNVQSQANLMKVFQKAFGMNTVFFRLVFFPIKTKDTFSSVNVRL